MRLDHIAYRVSERHKAAKFFVEAFDYRIANVFKINFDDGSIAECIVLKSPEEHLAPIFSARTYKSFWISDYSSEFHLPPEIFVSDGTPDSIVGRWVAERGGIGGVHHLAYEVEDVAAIMKDWKDKGLAEFTTDEPISNANDLVQCFTRPHPITGVIYEFIKKGIDNKGFNVNNVRDLMESTV